MHSPLVSVARLTQNETALKLVVCLDRNTAALQDCTDELRRA